MESVSPSASPPPTPHAVDRCTAPPVDNNNSGEAKVGTPSSSPCIGSSSASSPSSLMSPPPAPHSVVYQSPTGSTVIGVVGSTGTPVEDVTAVKPPCTYRYNYRGWVFEASRSAMLNSAELDKFGSLLAPDVDRLPDAVFGNNWLSFVKQRTDTHTHTDGSPVTTLPPPLPTTDRNGAEPDEVSQSAPKRDNEGAAVHPPDRYAASSFQILLDARGSLEGCSVRRFSLHEAPFGDFNPIIPKVSVEDVWRKKLQHAQKVADVRVVDTTHDWTFSSRYIGSVYLDGQVVPSSNLSTPTPTSNLSTPTPTSNLSTPTPSSATPTSATPSSATLTSATLTSAKDFDKPIDSAVCNGMVRCDEGVCMPMDKLSNESIPILWFQQVDFYDDDLSDWGLSRAEAKVRVMPDFWFALMRQSIRVDGVLFRQIDCRLYHDFDTRHVLREYIWKEATMAALEKRGHVFQPGNETANHINVGSQILAQEDIKFRIMSKITLPY